MPFQSSWALQATTTNMAHVTTDSQFGPERETKEMTWKARADMIGPKNLP